MQVFSDATDGRPFEVQLADATNYDEARAFANTIWATIEAMEPLWEKAKNENSRDLAVFEPLMQLYMGRYEAADAVAEKMR